MWRWFKHAARTIVGRGALQNEVSSEVQFHLDARAEDLIGRGLSPDEARRRARLEFGAIEAYREATRDAAGLNLLSDVRADLVYATRLARRQPAFALAAIGSLALGIGVNTLVFSVASGLVLRPLPVDQPNQLVTIQNGGSEGMSFPAYRDLRDRNATFAGIAGYRIAPMSLEHEGSASRAWGYLATGNYFDVIGVHPAAGRFFRQDEDRPPAESPVAVISYDYWIGRFGGATSVVGSTVRLNGMPYTVLGVTPRGFVGTEVFYRPDVWVPMTMQPQIEARTSWLESRGVMDTLVVGRLRPGMPRPQALADLASLSASIAHEHPSTDEGLSFRLAEPGLLGDALRTPIKAFSLGLLALATLVLLMACVNLAVMLTARGADRQRELAIRLSIGARRGRIVRQLLTETLLLAVVGGSVGLGIAAGVARALSAWRPPVDVPIQFDVTADVRVFAFALAVATAAGLLFGLAPALKASRTDAQATLKGLVPSSGGRRRWAMRDLLVAVQVAICVVLVAGCLLAIRGLRTALTMPIGFRPAGVTMVGYDLGLAGYSEARGADFERRAIDVVRRLPGIDRAAFGDTVPLYLNQSNTSAAPDDRPDLPASRRIGTARFDVSSEYFETMGTRILQGRGIEATDTARAPLVAVINETFAKRVFRTSAPLGRRFKDGGHGNDWVEVVGVAEDGKYQSLSEAPRPAVFEAISQNYQATISLVARSSLPSGQVVAEIRRAFAGLDPSIALYETQSVDDMLGVVLLPSRAAAIALGAFGVLAVLLALTGLHGVVTNAVAKRQREIGIRVAIGAEPGEILRLVLARTLLLLGAGTFAGFVLVLLGAKILASVVYEASPTDPLVLAGVGMCLAAVGLVACWAPARQALRVSPARALRSE
jgi:predicted permease